MKSPQYEKYFEEHLAKRNPTPTTVKKRKKNV